MTPATTPLTCAALYEYDLTFQCAIAKWVADRRCPIALGDYLQENGLDAAADCARWCATEPERRVMSPCRDIGERDTPCGPFPTLNRGKIPEWVWPIHYQGSAWFASSIPLGFVHVSHCGYHDSDVAAIIFLLDAWKPRT